MFFERYHFSNWFQSLARSSWKVGPWRTNEKNSSAFVDLLWLYWLLVRFHFTLTYFLNFFAHFLILSQIICTLSYTFLHTFFQHFASFSIVSILFLHAAYFINIWDTFSYFFQHFPSFLILSQLRAHFVNLLCTFS